MKISSINPINTNSVSFKHSAVPYPEYQRQTVPSFTHTAVPYPEYTNINDNSDNENKGIIEELAGKISNLFHPQVQKEAADIKANIDSLYETNKKTNEAVSAPQKLLSVFA